MTVQTCNILHGNSKRTLQVHSLIFREYNTDAMLQKAYFIQHFFFCTVTHCRSHREFFCSSCTLSFPRPTPLKSLTYKNIKSHTSFTGWSGGTNSRRTKATVKNINMLLMYELTSFLSLEVEGISFSTEVIKVRPRCITLISNTVPPASLKQNLTKMCCSFK